MTSTAQGSVLPTERRRLSGWGRAPSTFSNVGKPRGIEDILQFLSQADGRGVVARGLGRSYNDAAQLSGGLVLDMTRLDVIGPIEPESGLVNVEGGVSIDSLIKAALPQGWFVPVTPGTRQVTIGGAIAADIHGKNHHRDGSFCHSVTALTLVTPTGVHEVTPESDPDLFWATAGGMGLTGIVLRATVQLQPVETSWVSVDTHRYESLPLLMREMETSDREHHYSVAWVDCNAGGKRKGRSILTRGEHATQAQFEESGRRSKVKLPVGPRLRIPLQAPGGLINYSSITAFNELWFRKAPKERLGELQDVGTYFHPLDGLADWNLMYGPRGFLQYQLAVGDAHGAAVEEVIDLVCAARAPSFLAVLKRFGPGSPGPLSFPMAGWTLALDFPVGPAALPGLVAAMDDVVRAAGGRVYLAKDARVPADLVHQMYPRLPELQAVRDRVDPERMLQSDLARRLDI